MGSGYKNRHQSAAYAGRDVMHLLCQRVDDCLMRWSKLTESLVKCSESITSLRWKTLRDKKRWTSSQSICLLSTLCHQVVESSVRLKRTKCIIFLLQKFLELCVRSHQTGNKTKLMNQMHWRWRRLLIFAHVSAACERNNVGDAPVVEEMQIWVNKAKEMIIYELHLLVGAIRETCNIVVGLHCDRRQDGVFSPNKQFTLTAGVAHESSKEDVLRNWEESVSCQMTALHIQLGP